MENAIQEDELGVSNEIRALLNLLVRQHVKSWYADLSQDEQLFREFEDISSHIQKTLSGRVRAVDWPLVLNTALPDLVLRHLQDFNIAADRSRGDHSLEDAFLSLQGHQGISDQDSYLMHVADALLVILLPENDLLSEVAYSISREVMSDLVLRAIVDRLSEPWYWDELLLKCSKQYQNLIAQEKVNFSRRATSVFASIKRSLMKSLIHWHPGTVVVDRAQSPKSKDKWTYLQHPAKTFEMFTEQLKSRASIYDTAFPSILLEFTRPSNWAFAKASFFGVLLPLIDILLGEELSHAMTRSTRSAISHNSLAQMIQLARHILFPDDKPSPGRVVPSLSEQVALHAALQQALPSGVEIPFFSSKLINKVLIYKILDNILGTVFPELLKRSPEQLKEKIVHIRQANVEAEGSGGIRTGNMNSRPSSLHSPLSMSMMSAVEDGSSSA